MSTTKTVKIHHFDDEPNNISSIPKNIPAFVMAIRPEWIQVGELPDDDDENATSFIIKIHHKPGELFIIDYQIYRSSEEFLQQAKVNQGDLVLLDAFERGTNGEAVLSAKKCAEKVKQVVARERIFLVSAFCHTIPETLRGIIDEDCLIQKPFNVNDVCETVLRLVGISTLRD